MKKSKKIIVFLCLFLLSFSIVTDFKRQETQAIALVDDALLWAFGMLVLGTGVVAIKDVQVPHMGSLVLDNLKSSGVSDEEFLIKSADGVLKGIKIYDKVLNAVDYVAENLTSFDTSITEPSYDDSLNLYSFSINSVGTLPQGVVFPLFRAKILSNNIGSVKFSSSLGSYNIQPTGYLAGDEFEIMYYGVDNVRSKFQYRIWRNNKYLTGGVFLNSFDTFVTDIKVTYSSSLSSTFLVDENLNYIPYSNPVVKQGYNPTYTNESMPYTAEKPGFIPLPTETIMDKPITTELPLTWDDVKGNITDLPIDNTIPGENTGENEGENEGSLDGVLDDIFNPSTTKSLDFSPLYVSFSNKFPFSIPFDLARIISDFKANKQEPIFYVDMSGFSTNSTEAGFELDFTKFSVLFSIVRTFILVSFLVFLVIKTRDIIKA